MKDKPYKILLVYPKYPDTFWSFKHALKFISKKAIHPPLGLLTVASMIPEEWERKLVDMNVSKLKDKDIKWADYVFVSAMAVQKGSVVEVVKRCKALGAKIVAGGPLFTASHDEFDGIDHFVLNEAELTLKGFIDDLRAGQLKAVYSSNGFPQLEDTPIPSWELINMRKYVSMNLQYSRGCPFDCEFCDITTLFGRGVRTKAKKQVLDELDKLYELGWRGNVFFVDDNFIGNKRKLKEEVLPAIISWMKERRNPFNFSTEASINLSDDSELMEMMVKAGFDTVFIGIETPEEECLAECGKVQNKNRNLVESVKKIQKHGLEVTGGFIVGFDNDSPSIFDRQIKFIQESRIITAMVGLLNAPKDTRLYRRLKDEKRLLNTTTGDNTDLSMNFIPKMDYNKIVEGYKNILKSIYSAKPYYNRVKRFLKDHNNKKKFSFHLGYIRFHPGYPAAFLKSIFILGMKDKARWDYWKLLLWSLFRKPKLFPLAVTYAIYGYHFRKIFSAYM